MGTFDGRHFDAFVDGVGAIIDDITRPEGAPVESDDGVAPWIDSPCSARLKRAIEEAADGVVIPVVKREGMLDLDDLS